MFFTKVVILKLNNMKFTIFTPTYNRAYTLPRLYGSLVTQDSSDFEWLIVDDGSTDGTESLIKSYQRENKFPIIYLKQENAGKHIAINTGLKYAHGDYFFIIDSDDYLRPNVFSVLKEVVKKINEEYAGFTVIRLTDGINYNPEKYGKKEWTEGEYHWEYPGEMTFIYKTEIAKAFPFPVFKGEKFCQESLVHRRILERYKVLYTDHVLLGGNYLEDGLSANVWERMKKSPRYSMLNYSERIAQKTAKTKEEELEFAKIYWSIALSAKHIPWKEKLRGISIKYTIPIFWKKILKRFR